MDNSKCIIASFGRLLYLNAHSFSFHSFSYSPSAIAFHTSNGIRLFAAIVLRWNFTRIASISYMNNQQKKSLSHRIPSKQYWIRWYVCVFVASELLHSNKRCLYYIKNQPNSRGWEKLIFIYSNIYHLHTASSQLSLSVSVCIAIHCHISSVLLTHAAVLSKFWFPSIFATLLYMYIALYNARPHLRTAFHFWSTTHK